MVARRRRRGTPESAESPRIIGRMLLALDVGNTNITLALIEGAQPAQARRAPTGSALTADGLERVLDGLLMADGVSLAGVDDLVLASVVPAVTGAVSQLCSRRGMRLLVADADTIPMAVRVDHPSDVGADRLVNAFAGLRLYGAPVIVVDFGTATTFDVVDAGGAFVGGAIAPGIQLGAEALASRTAMLPKVDLALPAQAIGKDTVSAIQSGVVIGYIGLVRELIVTITAELAGNRGQQPKVIMTGGLSQAEWADEIHADAVDPDLTLRGLALLHSEVGAAAAQAATA
jgi:type III pantothenate kinase